LKRDMGARAAAGFGVSAMDQPFAPPSA
jgi:hypothetical protein